MGVWDEQMQTITHRMDKHKVLPYSTGNYIQYSIINHNGKNIKKNIYIYMSHFAVHQKLIQHCKTTIP